MTNVRELLTQATLLLKSGQYDEAKGIFKTCMNTVLENDQSLTTEVIRDIATGYESAATGQPDALQYSLNSLKSMREIFPQDNNYVDAQIARSLSNLYYDYPKDLNSATKLELLGHLNEGLSLVAKYTNINELITNGLRTKIEDTCNQLLSIAVNSVDHQEELAIFSNISSSIQAAFPEGHPKTGLYIYNLGITQIILGDTETGLLNLHKSIETTKDKDIVKSAVAKICQSSKALFADAKTSLLQKIAISEDMSEHLPQINQNGLECSAYMVNALANEYTKLAITAWHKILPSLAIDTKQIIQSKIDSSCVNLGYTNTEDCITTVIGLTVDSDSETIVS